MPPKHEKMKKLHSFTKIAVQLQIFRGSSKHYDSVIHQTFISDSSCAVVWQSSGSHQSVISQSPGSHQPVIRQSSGSHQVVISQSSGSHQVVICRSGSKPVVIWRSSGCNGEHQAVIRQSSSNHSDKLTKEHHMTLLSVE